MKIKTCFLLILFLIPVSAWTMPTSITKTDDGYVIAGLAGLSYSLSNAWVLKVDKEGNEVWNKTYVGDFFSHARHVIRFENGYLVGGFTGIENFSPWIIRLDEFGNVIWEKKFIEYKIGGVTGIAFDGEEILAILSVDNNDSGTYTLLVKLNAEGREIWRKKIDNSSIEYESIKMLKKISYGYVGVGYIIDYDDWGIRNYDVWVLKLRDDGGVDWSRFYDLENDEMAWDFVEVENGYIVAGGSNERQKDCRTCGCEDLARAFVIKLDFDGNVEWIKFFEVGNATWSIVFAQKLFLAGGGKNVEGNFLWISDIDKQSPIVLRKNFSLLSMVYGYVRAVEAEDGILITASSCDGKCLWLGKLDRDKIVWERNYFPNPPLNSSLLKSVEIEESLRVSNEKEEKISVAKAENLIDVQLIYAILLALIALILALAISKI